MAGGAAAAAAASGRAAWAGGGSSRGLQEVTTDVGTASSVDISADQQVVAVGARTKLVLLRLSNKYRSMEKEETIIIKDSKHGGKAISLKPIVKVKFNPTLALAHLVATTSSAGKVGIWDIVHAKASRGQCEPNQVLSEHKSSVGCLAWHYSDPQTLLTGSNDKTIRFWDLRVKDRSKLTLDNHQYGFVRDIQFRKEEGSHEFAAAFAEGVVQVWDMRQTAKPQRHYRTHVEGGALSVDWNPDATNLLASGGRDGYIRVWDMNASMQTDDSTVHASGLGSAASPAPSLDMPSRARARAPSSFKSSTGHWRRLSGDSVNLGRSAATDSYSARKSKRGLKARPAYEIRTGEPVMCARWRPEHPYQIIASSFATSDLTLWNLMEHRVPLTTVQACAVDDTVNGFLWLDPFLDPEHVVGSSLYSTDWWPTHLDDDDVDDGNDDDYNDPLGQHENGSTAFSRVEAAAGDTNGGSKRSSFSDFPEEIGVSGKRDGAGDRLRSVAQSRGGEAVNRRLPDRSRFMTIESASAGALTAPTSGTVRLGGAGAEFLSKARAPSPVNSVADSVVTNRTSSALLLGGELGEKPDFAQKQEQQQKRFRKFKHSHANDTASQLSWASLLSCTVGGEITIRNLQNGVKPLQRFRSNAMSFSVRSRLAATYEKIPPLRLDDGLLVNRLLKPEELAPRPENQVHIFGAPERAPPPTRVPSAGAAPMSFAEPIFGFNAEQFIALAQGYVTPYTLRKTPEGLRLLEEHRLRHRALLDHNAASLAESFVSVGVGGGAGRGPGPTSRLASRDPHLNGADLRANDEVVGKTRTQRGAGGALEHGEGVLLRESRGAGISLHEHPEAHPAPDAHGRPEALRIEGGSAELGPAHMPTGSGALRTTQHEHEHLHAMDEARSAQELAAALVREKTLEEQAALTACCEHNAAVAAAAGARTQAQIWRLIMLQYAPQSVHLDVRQTAAMPGSRVPDLPLSPSRRRRSRTASYGSQSTVHNTSMQQVRSHEPESYPRADESPVRESEFRPLVPASAPGTPPLVFSRSPTAPAGSPPVGRLGAKHVRSHSASSAAKWADHIAPGPQPLQMLPLLTNPSIVSGGQVADAVLAVAESKGVEDDIDGILQSPEVKEAELMRRRGRSLDFENLSTEALLLGERSEDTEVGPESLGARLMRTGAEEVDISLPFSIPPARTQLWRAESINLLCRLSLAMPVDDANFILRSKTLEHDVQELHDAIDLAKPPVTLSPMPKGHRKLRRQQRMQRREKFVHYYKQIYSTQLQLQAESPVFGPVSTMALFDPRKTAREAFPLSRGTSLSSSQSYENEMTENERQRPSSAHLEASRGRSLARAQEGDAGGSRRPSMERSLHGEMEEDPAAKDEVAHQFGVGNLDRGSVDDLSNAEDVSASVGLGPERDHASADPIGGAASDLDGTLPIHHDSPPLGWLGVSEQTLEKGDVILSPFHIVTNNTSKLKSDLVHSILEHHADQGDVQMCATLLLVLGDLLEPQVDATKKRKWVCSYVDLLQQLRVFSVAVRVISASDDEDVKRLYQMTSRVAEGCSFCIRTQPRSLITMNEAFTGKCHTCKNTVSRCAICEQVVKGVYVWCQGCGHAGHLDHMTEWFRTETTCPAGCGHTCTMAHLKNLTHGPETAR